MSEKFSEFLRNALCRTFETHREFEGGYLVPNAIEMHRELPITNDETDTQFLAHIAFLNRFFAAYGLGVPPSYDGFGINFNGRQYDVLFEDGKFVVGHTYLDMLSPTVTVDMSQYILSKLAFHETPDTSV